MDRLEGQCNSTLPGALTPIVQQEITITRVAVTNEKDAEKKDREMGGRKHIVPYGLYRGEGYVSAPLAERTGFTDEDLDLLWEALINMFDHDHSAARGARWLHASFSSLNMKAELETRQPISYSIVLTRCAVIP